MAGVALQGALGLVQGLSPMAAPEAGTPALGSPPAFTLPLFRV